MKIKFDTYSTYARIFPAILSSLPIFIIWYFFSKNNELNALFEYLLSVNFLKETTFSLIFLYLFSQVIRVSSKRFEESLFTNADGFPTTYLLTYENDTFSSSYKDKFRENIKRDFKLDLLNKDEELLDLKEANRRITESIALVRLKIGNGKLVLQHNIWYGFFRNLIGGSIYAILFSIIGCILSITIIPNIILLNCSLTLLLLYSIIIFFRKAILIQNAEAYAKQLISEYMFSNK